MYKYSTQKIIGIMSGTSLDGLDLACVEFKQENGKINWDWVSTHFVEYPPEWIDKLRNAHLLSAVDLLKLDVEYGKYLGEKVNEFIKKDNLKNIDAISSHGHTIFHQPNKGFTLQIGSGSHIQAETNIKVICDFRSQDVALGGQGAPLVPIGDKLLFSEYDACINLGGFANISFDNDKNERIAFDICPVNFVLNFYANQLGLAFDKNGEIAKIGTIQNDLLNQLNSIDFYQQKGAKSLGREWVENEIFPLINQSSHEIKDIVATFTEHISIQITEILNKNNLKKTLFSGGGTLNKFLIQKIEHKTSSKIITADNQLLNYKESLIFALLGYLKINNQPNILKSVTGSKRDISSGIIYI